MGKIQKALNALREGQTERALHKSAHRRSAAENRLVTEQSQQAGGDRATVGSRPQAADREIEELRNCIDDFEKRLRASGLLPSDDQLPIIEEQFRRIKRPILQYAFDSELPTGKNSNVIMMASALPGAGKSFCSVSLARSIDIERDVGTVLIDADVLKPGISRSLGLQDSYGLIDYLIDPDIALADILHRTDSNGILVLPAGRRHEEATELLASKRMKDLVSLLSTRFENRAVIFDTPPLLLTNEAQVLAEQMGQIVFVIEARVSSQESVLRALNGLDRSKPINAILNKSRSASQAGYQSDDYGYYPQADRKTINA